MDNGDKMEESELAFLGTRIAITGINNENLGMAHIYLSGKKEGTINVYVVKDTFNNAL